MYRRMVWNRIRSTALIRTRSNCSSCGDCSQTAGQHSLTIGTFLSPVLCLKPSSGNLTNIKCQNAYKCIFHLYHFYGKSRDKLKKIIVYCIQVSTMEILQMFFFLLYQNILRSNSNTFYEGLTLTVVIN